MKTLGQEGLAQSLAFTNAIQKLRWSADGGEWSAQITPLECHAILDELERLQERQVRTFSGEGFVS